MLPAKTARTRSVGTKLSEEEYARLEALASQRGLTVGEWVREVVIKAGEPFSLDHLSDLVRVHVDAALSADGKPGKRGACHLFRHTMATLMLEGGADIRFIQQMLGHASLSTTEIYTHVSIRMLKQVHSTTHPAASLDKKNAPPLPGHSTPASEAEALFATLDAEAEEEEEGKE